MGFTARSLASTEQLLGEKLRALRRDKGVTLEALTKLTKLQVKYLEALERGRYEELPEPLYARNYLRSYVKALGADESYFLELYDEEVAAVDYFAHYRMPRTRLQSVRLFVLSRLLRTVMIAGVFLALFSYIGYEINALYAPPWLKVVSPEDSQLVSAPQLEVVGQVENEEVDVYVNGDRVVVDEGGTFRGKVNLTLGPNELRVEAKRRYSRRAIVKRTVVYSESD